MSAHELDELTRDALSEVLNLGVGRAAASLSEMLHQEILLTVPEVKLVTREEAAAYLASAGGGLVCAVSQTFDGQLNGTGFMLFPQDDSLALVRAMLDTDLPTMCLTELEREVLVEVGNIILNACFGSISNFLGLEVCSGLPEYRQGAAELLFAGMAAGANLLLVHVSFRAADTNIQGFLSFAMDMQEFEHFAVRLRERFGLGG
ncbi:MAG: chemotaxis protein CheC [Gammaproteobacteria bacterium]|nr:chemotaxis protein CheC [Gammaproteobacteria bacterium]